VPRLGVVIHGPKAVAPLKLYLAGKKGQITSKDCNFFPGETVEKQLIVINNSREIVTAELEWSLGLPQPIAGKSKVSIKTGDQTRETLRFDLPAGLSAGVYPIRAVVRFSNGEVQKDEFSIHVVPRPAALKVQKIAVFDPKGETRKLLTDANVAFDAVDANVDLSGYELFIIGKEALSVDGPGPNVDRVSLTGLKVIVFEQAAKVLVQRFGFRATEYGLREVFPRVPDHPALAGLDNCLHDWRGEATSVPARLDYVLKPQHGPTVKWCGIDVSRVWRCGNRGNVASG
jgi:beta-galactosidase